MLDACNKFASSDNFYAIFPQLARGTSQQADAKGTSAVQRKNRISQDVTDISSPAVLLRFATAGQVERLLQRRRGLTQGAIAQGAGMGTNSRSAGPALSRALSVGPTIEQLAGLDEIIGALSQDPDGAGGLSSLALRLSSERRDEVRRSGLAARVPLSWTRRILSDQPADEVGVLMQASTLLSDFMAAERMDASDIIASIGNRYAGELDLLVHRLIMISAGPPDSRHYDAQILLGMLASYAFRPMMNYLDYELRHSPTSFRVWPAITKLVRLSKEGEHTGALKSWVRQLVTDSGVLRKDSLYAGPGLDLELAICVPAAWSPPGDDWVGDALRARARNDEATIRERGTAAMGLWQRARAEEGQPSLGNTREELHQLIAEFRDPRARPDAAAGLRWLAATLEYAIDQDVAVCNNWPDVDEDWFRRVQDAADELGRQQQIPDHLRGGIKNLFLHMILQNAGIHRREAIETVAASGWTEPVAAALASLLQAEHGEAWLRIRAEFALSSLQRQDVSVETALVRACEQAYQRLRLDQASGGEPPSPSCINEMHASLFAVGDYFGATGAQENSRSTRENTREKLQPILAELAEARGNRAILLQQPARAAAYLLAVTAQPEHIGRRDLSRDLLERLSHHPDPVTAKLSRWVLSFRFGPAGEIRPLLAAAEFGKVDDTL
jgi:hypothetical protein